MSHKISLNKTHLELKKNFLYIDLKNRKTIATDHFDRINSIAVWKNKYIFTASIDDKIHIYNILTSQKKGEFPSFGDPVVSMEIFNMGSNSMLCFSDLCQRIFLVKITSKKLIRMQNHSADIMQILYLRDNRSILLSDTKWKLFSWDFRTNHLQECLSSLCLLENTLENSSPSFLKLLDESFFPQKNLICIGVNIKQLGFLILATPYYSPTKKLQDLNILKRISFEQRIRSMNFSFALNSFILGSNSSSLIMANLTEKNEIITKNIPLICAPQSKITAIAIIESKDSGNCWAIATNDADKKLLIIDLKNEISYEIYDSLVSILYSVTKSNMEIFERKGRFYLALVSHATEFLLFYEISLKFNDKNTPSLNFLKEEESNEKILYEIYVFWYGHPPYLAETLSKKSIKNVDFPTTHLQYLWTKLWFAKNEDQRKIDDYLKKFEGLFNEDFSALNNQNFFIDFSLLILYDQISRNIFRKSEKAYSFDKKALKIAEKYKENLHCLALQNILTVLICFLHSENINDQIFVKKQIDVLKLRYGMQYNEIISHLSLIHQNHHERIQLFGRIPERNPYLGRQSTKAEMVYIKSVDSSKIY